VTPSDQKVRPRRRPLWFWLPFMAVVLDIVAVLLAAILAYALRFSEPFRSVRAPRAVPEVGEYFVFGIVLGLVYVLVARSYQGYSSRLRPPPEQEVGRILTGAILSMGVVLAAIFLYREFNYSRAVFLGTLAFMIPLLILVRAIFYRVQKALFHRGLGVRRVAFWGWGSAAQSLWSEFAKGRAQGFELVGAMDDAPVPGETTLGPLRALSDVVAKEDIDLLILAPPPGEEDRMAEGLQAAEGLPVELLYVPGAAEITPSHIQLAELSGKPLLRLKTVPMAGARYIVKRLFDLGKSVFWIPCLSPLMALIALGIYAQGGRPIVIRERRVGLDGREFYLWRFRTRPVGKEDESVTPFGRFLTRWALDKLPQLVNVFRGEMSLVGPHPEPPQVAVELQKQFPVYLDRRRVKSGITGWAQVKGFAGGSSAERAELDLQYMEQWSLWFDIRIFCLAVAKTLRGKSTT
jgi:exopolysaccharide biosynthesis polyprenyl glycosylphosphotransferase